MTGEVKLRLYVTAIVIVVVIIYVGPLIVISNLESDRAELFARCSNELPRMGHDYCWRKSKSADFSLWKPLLPYLPAGAVLWLNWLIRPRLKLSDESYPKRTMNVLLWLGLLFAAWGISQPIMWAVYQSTEAISAYNLTPRDILTMPWLAAAWLSAPLLFHHLVAPTSLAASMRKGRIALALVAAAPIVASVLILFRY